MRRAIEDWSPLLLRPLRYRLHLDCDAAAKTFRGEVEIVLAVDASAREVRLDCEALQIEEASIDGVAVAWRIDAGALLLEPSGGLQPGEATVRIRYRAELGAKREGLYLGDGFIATQMQPENARRVFPCFDAPRHRCVFDLSVMADAGHVAISNAPVLDAGDASVRRRVTFAPTPPLPTYLLALATGPFESLQADGESPIAVHALHTPARFASTLDHARSATAFYTELLARPFPFAKLDIVVLPRTSIAGMENSGAIFLREDDASRAELVAHEVAHQWFGGLVTPRDWHDLWLNEGFATWLAATAVPDSEVDEVRLMREALHRDCEPGARALAGSETRDITALFDATAYRKGAALLRMLERWIGEDAFARGLRAYLDRHAFGTATSQDLWQALEAETRLPMAAVAHTFATRPGAPHVVIDIAGTLVEIVQATQAPWRIPMRLRVAFEDGEQQVIPVFLEQARTKLEFAREVKWVFGNADAAGWYRCTYLGPCASKDSLPATEAVVLIEDAWLALWHGETDLIAYLSLAHGSSDAHLDEVKDLLASGARVALFDRWLGDAKREIETASLSDLENESLDEPARIAAVEALLANPATRAACWAFVKQKWDEIGRSLLGWGGRGLFAGLGAFSDPAAAADIAQFFATHPVPGNEHLLRATLDRITARSRFREAHQAAMDAFLMRLDAPAAPPPQRVRDEHALLALMAAGFRGALLHRNLFDHFKITPPPWMHTIDNLRGAVSAAERQLVLVHRGAPVVRSGDADLAKRLVDDLRSAADHIAASDAPEVVAAGMARASAMHEREREAELVFASLFGDDDAQPLRVALAAAKAESAFARAWLVQVPEAELLREQSLLLPALLRLHAHRLQARLAALGFAQPSPATSTHRTVTLPDGAVFTVEVTLDFAAGRLGLMHRDALPERGGMLFVHEDDAPRPVTMRNVRMPLDVIWLDVHGVVLHVEHSLPPWREGPFPADPRQAHCRFVLELSGGTASRHGVAIGSRVSIDQ